MNGAECLLRTLLANRVNLCLMNPGTSEMQFVSALDRVPGMRAILCLFEGVCSGAADGYARMTGRPAATLLHLGPGLANGLANFHNARKARSPVVSIVGEHATGHLRYDAPLTANTEAFARTVSDWVTMLARAGDMGAAASAAVAAAIGPPGRPATLIVPADYSWSEAGEPGAAAPHSAPRTPSASRVREVAQALGRGEPCGLLLSGGALSARALEAAGRVQAATGARVFGDRYAGRMTRGRGVFPFERIPYFPEPAQALLAEMRRLVLVEAHPPVSFFGYDGVRSTLAPEACDLPVLAAPGEDGTAALEMLAEECGAPPRVQFTDAQPAPFSGDDALTTAALGRAVAALLPEDAIVSDEMVSSNEAIWPHLGCAPRHDFLPVAGGSIGQGLPVAVGAALACPDRKVVALEADGSGMYTLQALWTMARENLDVTTVILANRRYRILEVEMRRTGGGAPGPCAAPMMDIGRPDLDWVSLARGLGVEASRAQTAAEFTAQFGRAIESRGPRLIEAVLA